MLKFLKYLPLFLLLSSPLVAGQGGVIWRNNTSIGSPSLLQYNKDGNWNTLNVLNPVNTTTLKAIPITGLSAGATVHRQGFYSADDGGGQSYYLSTSACSISAGAGNDFTQVKPNSGTGCWIAIPQPKGYDIRAAGIIAGDVGTYSSANAAIMTKIFAEPNGPAIIVPKGYTFRLACSTYWSATAGVHFTSGEALSGGTLKFDTGCNWTDNVAKWDGVSGGGSSGVTWDLNTPTSPTTSVGVISVKASAGNVTSFIWDNSPIINGVTKLFLIAGSANNTYTLSGLIIKNSYLQMTAATTQNQCIALSTNSNAGTITEPIIDNNICVGSAIQGDGARQRITNNDVSGFKFGTGIFTAFHATSDTDYTSTDCYVAGNVIHDTTDQLDANSSPPGGFENNCLRSVVSNNIFLNLSGEAIRNYSNRATYENNYAYGVGKSTLASEAGHTAFSIVVGAKTRNQSLYTTWIGNVVDDDGTSTMHQSFRTGSGADGTVDGSNNQFATGTVAAFVQTDAAADVRPTLIRYTKKVIKLTTAVSSIDFTGLDTASYNSWTLNCQQFLPTSADVPALKVSENNGSTWLSGSYTSSGQDISGGTASSVNLVAQNTMKIGNISWIADNSVRGSFTVTFSNLTSTASWKQFAYRGNARNSANPRLVNIGVGSWEGDTNAINAVQVVTHGGATFKATCTLTGEL